MKYLFIPIPIGETKESKPEGYIESLDLAVKEIEKTGFSEVIHKDDPTLKHLFAKYNMR